MTYVHIVKKMIFQRDFLENSGFERERSSYHKIIYYSSYLQQGKNYSFLVIPKFMDKYLLLNLMSHFAMTSYVCK